MSDVAPFSRHLSAEGIPEMRALKNIDVAFVRMNLPYTMPPDEAADAVRASIRKLFIRIITAAPI
jgi:hypothetical protein